MRSRQLECFVRVCELGSITRAAATLNIAQPALGVQIKALEREFGVKLVDRTPTGTSPTPAGAMLLDEARHILRRIDHLKRRLREADAQAHHSLRLGMPASLTGILASRLLERVHAAIPELTLSIIEEPSHRVIEHLQAGQLDIGLAYGVGPGARIRAEPRLREPLHLITTPGSPLDLPRPLPLRDLVTIDLTMPGEGDIVRQLVEDTLKAHGLRLRVTYPVHSMPAMKDVVARGLASAILPLSAVAREVEAGALVARPITDPPITRTLCIGRPGDIEPTPVLERLHAQIAGLLDELCRESGGFEALPAHLRRMAV